jgi:hypothetical protein
MATRFVFKFWGSIGPAGSLVGLTEKVCTAIFPHAYSFGDEATLETPIDKELKQLRQAYVTELFKFKGTFTKAINHKNSGINEDEAWD